MVSDADLIERLESVQGSIDGLREDTRDKVRTNRRAIVAAILIGLLGIVVGAIGIKHGIDADRSTGQRKIAACEQSNDQTARSIIAAERTSDNFIDDLASAAKANPKADRAKVKAFVVASKNAQHRVIVKNYPKRDCSPAGLNAFYAPKGTS